jgi:hypothetical protein
MERKFFDIVVAVLFAVTAIEFFAFMGGKMPVSGFAVYSALPSEKTNFILIIFLLMFAMLFVLLAIGISETEKNSVLKKFLAWLSGLVQKTK